MGFIIEIYPWFFIRKLKKKKKEGMDEVVTLWYFLSLPFFFFFRWTVNFRYFRVQFNLYQSCHFQSGSYKALVRLSIDRTGSQKTWIHKNCNTMNETWLPKPFKKLGGFEFTQFTFSAWGALSNEFINFASVEKSKKKKKNLSPFYEFTIKITNNKIKTSKSTSNQRKKKRILYNFIHLTTSKTKL